MVMCVLSSKSQKIDSIFFNLYTDSLKRGTYNYINVDGKLHNGSFFPLTPAEIILEASAGTWQGNSLVIDSSYSKDSVVISAQLKTNPVVKKTITIYIKKGDDNEALLTEDELLRQMKKRKKG